MNEFINKVVFNFLIFVVIVVVCGFYCRKLIYFIIILGKFFVKYVEVVLVVMLWKEEFCFWNE